MAEQTLDESIQHEDELFAISFVFRSTCCFIFALILSEMKQNPLESYAVTFQYCCSGFGNCYTLEDV